MQLTACSCMMHAMMRRKQITKEDQPFSTLAHHGRIPTHGGSATGSGSKEAHRYTQYQLPRLPAGAPMAPLSDMPAEAKPSADDASAGSCWVKPGCMMELSRLAKIPQPASGLMCPRCRSTETKFCYYNNYSLSQPRHFCKTCRRYWTHGGALRDLPFSSSVRRHRRNKPSNNKHTSSKVASFASGSTGSSSSSSSSSSSASATIFSGRAAAATAILQPLEQLLIGGAEHRRAGASRLWFPGHSSQDPAGYRHHQLGNSIGSTTMRRPLEQCYLPQRQPFSFLGYKNVGNAAATSAIFPFTSGGGGTEPASLAGQMHAAVSRARDSAALTTTELASEMMAESPPIPSTEMGTLASSPGEFLVGLQGESDLFLHCLGSRSWACGHGSTAGNGGGGGSCCTAAPGSAWPDPSGFTSSSSCQNTVL